MQKTCFVVMPIRKSGTAEYSHFRAIFDQIRPTLESAGYVVFRGDDVQKAGAITKDIISRLADSDLVVADLTDLNPNVFYELGVRHALRGRGTIMILDERRTPDIPFDLSAYRVIRFTGDLTGIEPLKTALHGFIGEAQDPDATHRDSPVHDWFPALPVNVVDTSAQSTVGPLRKTIKELEDRVAQYEMALGTRLTKSPDSSPLTPVLAALSDAEEGLLPMALMDEVRRAFESRDVVSLLKKIRTILERKVRLPSTAFIALARYAMVLDLTDVARAIFEQALQHYPSDGNLRRAYLARLAHSDAAVDRERAREEIRQELGLEVTADAVLIREPKGLQQDMSLLGLLMDAYHREKLDAEALLITEKIAEMFPQNSTLLRNHARAHERVGQNRKALELFRAACLVPDVNDVSAVWLGSALHNYDRFAEAAEAYALACLLDPSDASNFAHLAEELATCIAAQHQPMGAPPGMELPHDITSAQVVQLFACAASCPNVDAVVSDRLQRAVDRLGVEVGELPQTLVRAQRIECVKAIYDTLRSDLTTPGRDYDLSVLAIAASSEN